MANENASAVKEAFGIRLRNLRRDAGLTGRQLALQIGVHNSKVSRIEHGTQSPTEEDIRGWAIACGVARQIPELIAVHREIEQIWLEWRRELRAGQKHIQSRSTPLYEGTRLLRVYEPLVVPGILQTRAYFRAIMEQAALFYGTPLEDVDEATDARLERQHLITQGTGKNLYIFLIEAGALDHIFGDADVMREQLEFLLTVTRLPHVVLGIIPKRTVRRLWGAEGFYLFDERLVRSSFWTGALRSKQKEDLSFFLKVFETFQEMAVFGDPAREIIRVAASKLQTPATS